MRLLVLIVSLFFAPAAFAFPDMVRHGYVHCTACHTSLAGGNVLNEYGRALSREVLSQPSLGGRPVVDGDENFLYGFTKPVKGLLLGGDIRLLQLFSESKTASRGRFMIMQVDFDAFYEVSKRVRAFFSVGRVEPLNADPTAKDYVASPRHGLEYQFTAPDAENRVALRVGRFMPAYGIGFAEHTFVTRRLLNFMPSQERLAAELSWNNDRASVIATGLFQQFQNNDTKPEAGGILQVAHAVGDNSKVGVNYYQSELKTAGTKFTQRALGAYAHMAFTKNFYGLLEVDRIKGRQNTWGFIDTFKLGYEVHQGWHLIGVHEFANLDMDKSNPKFEAYSVGTEWFPRPHWDFLALYRKERNSGVRNSFDDVVWLVAHFYL